MDISMYTCYALSLGFATPTDAFAHFYKKGVRYADIVDNELSEIPLELYCKHLKDAGISPFALISTIDITSESNLERNRNISTAKGYIDKMEKLGLSLLMPAPSIDISKGSIDFERVREREISALSDLIEYAKGSQIKIAIENQSTFSRPDSKADDVRYILDTLPELGFVLDSGNFFCVGENVSETFHKFQDRMIHSHFKDWKKSSTGYYKIDGERFDGTSLGNGILPLAELIDKFTISGYEGKIVLEINSPNITLETLDLSAEFLFKHMMNCQTKCNS